ncbi:unnamed protein product [Protopolystoma xenopodis]|uniref:Uncharacterized protein n=1 Tax=Protopolystoma xenopodis TaxID=117903 RepID=A0A3S5AA56_9PLAT|nr:unnamed protein product [Protopolystoma xenopodis]
MDSSPIANCLKTEEQVQNQGRTGERSDAYGSASVMFLVKREAESTSQSFRGLPLSVTSESTIITPADSLKSDKLHSTQLPEPRLSLPSPSRRSTLVPSLPQPEYQPADSSVPSSAQIHLSSPSITGQETSASRRTSVLFNGFPVGPKSSIPPRTGPLPSPLQELLLTTDSKSQPQSQQMRPDFTRPISVSSCTFPNSRVTDGVCLDPQFDESLLLNAQLATILDSPCGPNRKEEAAIGKTAVGDKMRIYKLTQRDEQEHITLAKQKRPNTEQGNVEHLTTDKGNTNGPDERASFSFQGHSKEYPQTPLMPVPSQSLGYIRLPDATLAAFTSPADIKKFNSPSFLPPDMNDTLTFSMMDEAMLDQAMCYGVPF